MTLLFTLIDELERVMASTAQGKAVVTWFSWLIASSITLVYQTFPYRKSVTISQNWGPVCFAKRQRTVWANLSMWNICTSSTVLTLRQLPILILKVYLSIDWEPTLIFISLYFPLPFYICPKHQWQPPPGCWTTAIRKLCFSCKRNPTHDMWFCNSPLMCGKPCCCYGVYNMC